MAKARRRAARISSRRRLRPHIWLARHLQVALASLGRLARAPLSSLMTVGVIGIALALPGGLHLMLANIQAVSGGWDGAATISLYLNRQLSSERTGQLADQLRTRPGVSRVRVIGREQALDEFRRLSGFSDILETLDQNPLPPVLVIEPARSHSTPAAAEALQKELAALVEVEVAQLDLQWVQRFHAMTEIAGRVVWVLACLLGLAVLLIVVNTIRLEIQNRRAEIEITKLIGATDAFIRRPFLYSGVWYGLSGGLISWLLITLSLWLLKAPVARLAGLYDSNFDLTGMDLISSLALLGASTLLGLAGSWLAVGRHLREIEPC